MRILHVSAGYWPFWGGAERHLQAISERFAAAGHEVVVLCSNARVAEAYWSPGLPGHPLTPDEHHGVQIQRCRVAHLLNHRQSFPTLRRAAILIGMVPGTTPLLRRAGRYMPWLPDYEARLHALGPFDLVHGFNISLESPLLAGFQYARRAGIPFVTTPFVHTGVHGDRHVERHYTMPHQLELLRGADWIFAMSEIERRRLVALGVDGARISELGAGVSAPRVTASEIAAFRRAHHLTRPYVAFLGSVTRDKGAITLVGACRRLWQEPARDFDLVLGGVPVREFSEFHAALEPATRARVHLLGALTEADKWRLLAGSELFAMPSRVDSFGIAYLEAWSQGRAVIGARAGGVPDVITEREDGLLVPFGDEQALATALATLLDDPALRQRLAAAGGRKLAARYNWPRLYAEVERRVRTLVTASRAVPA